MFKFLLDRVWKRINSWNDRFLSYAGKEVMLKVVVQVIPTFVMSYSQISLVICKKMRQYIMDAWWGSIEDLEKFTGIHGSDSQHIEI